MEQPLDILERCFGYRSFRPGQGEVAQHLLQGRDVLSVMPTGAGKSICFQVPALCLEGIALVISPLISLMKDQVGALLQAGVRAAYLNSSLTERQFGLALRNARQGKYKIIYVAPERLETESFLAFARHADISLLAVDEAHCISQWGQDFRPSYLNIPQFLKTLPKRPVVGAFTATATPQVREDIARSLELQDPFTLVTGFDRPNLFFQVDVPKSKKEALLRFLKNRREESGVIYCATRKTVEEICTFLQERGFSAGRYHAGLESGERQKNQEAFSYGRVRLMVATNAFGMGIDKSDVRFVVHYNMPKDVESYYQEAGRAGRDGEEAYCLLLYSPGDVRTNQFLIELRGEEETDEGYEQRVQREQERLKHMTVYCRTTGCLRGYLLRYFGESAKEHCGKCGSCLANFQELDITRDAQQILSCVRRAGERFGAGTIIDILRGADTERIRSWSLDTLSTYGLMRDYSRDEVQSRIQYLLESGCLVQAEGQYPTLALGPKARSVLFEGETLIAQVRSLPREAVQTAVQGASAPVDQNLLRRLQQLRGRLAQQAGVPGYVVFSDKTLREMASMQPQTLAQMQLVNGVGDYKLDKYGQKFLDVILQWQEEGETDNSTA